MSGRPEPLDVVGWAADLLRAIRAPTSTESLVSVTAWALAEGGHTANDAAWNPLNTTLRRPGSSSMNGVGVQRYRSYADGLAATVATINLPRYSQVVAALRSSAAASRVAELVGASGWGTSAALMLGTIKRARAMVAAHSPLASTYTAPASSATTGRTVPRIFPVVDNGPRLAAVRVNGSKLTADVVAATTRAALSVTASEVTQLELTIEDPGLRLARTGLFHNRTLVDYGPLDLEVAAFEINGGQSGRGGLVVTARPRGVQALRRLTSLTMVNVSPSSYAAECARRAGLVLVAEGSPVRPRIELKAEAGQPREDAWAGLARLAEELGFVCYEAAGVLYFGRPSWLVGVLPPHTVTWRDGATDPLVLGHPVCRRTVDDPDAAVTIGLTLHPDLGERFLIGSALHLAGIPSFVGRYAVTSATVDLASAEGVVDVAAETPDDPEPQPPDSGDPSPDGAANPAAGTVSAGASKDGWRHPLNGAGRNSHNFGQNRGDHIHAGTDMGAATGTPIYAARAGTVTFSGPAGSYGNLVKIAHAGGYETRYAHQVRTPPVRAGQQVAGGELIGHVGSTGRSTGPHLHYEVRLNGTPQNPDRFLP